VPWDRCSSLRPTVCPATLALTCGPKYASISIFRKGWKCSVGTVMIDNGNRGAGGRTWLVFAVWPWITHNLSWDGIQDYSVRSCQLTAWARARQFFKQKRLHRACAGAGDDNVILDLKTELAVQTTCVSFIVSLSVAVAAGCSGECRCSLWW
jgi:hypothetical protein